MSSQSMIYVSEMCTSAVVTAMSLHRNIVLLAANINAFRYHHHRFTSTQGLLLLLLLLLLHSRLEWKARDHTCSVAANTVCKHSYLRKLSAILSSIGYRDCIIILRRSTVHHSMVIHYFKSHLRESVGYNTELS